MAFMRSYAMAGDAMRLLPKRKQATAGPRAKAARKATVRMRRMLRYSGDPFLGMVPAAAAAAAPAMGKAIGGLKGIGAWLSSPAGKAALGQVAGFVGRGFGVGGGGGVKLPAGIVPGGLPIPGLGGTGGRRSMNVANVKALRRGLRRVEGFKKLVARVDKLMPSGAKIRGSRSKSHGKGCRCVACK